MTDLVTSDWKVYLNTHFGEPLPDENPVEFVVRGTIHGLTAAMQADAHLDVPGKTVYTSGEDKDRVIFPLFLPKFSPANYDGTRDFSFTFPISFTYAVPDIPDDDEARARMLKKIAGMKFGISFDRKIIARIDHYSHVC